jgi:hypothetical protein
VIERFNFYDVFGFFIPGSVLLLLLWLPVGLARRSFPSSDLTSSAEFAKAVYRGFLELPGSRDEEEEEAQHEQDEQEDDDE